MTIKHIPFFILLTSISGFSMAAGAPVGVQFPEGEPVDPAGANANFQELADRIDDVDTAQTEALESATTDISEEVSGLSAYIQSSLSSLTDEFYALVDQVVGQAAATSNEIAGLSAQISENEMQDVTSYIELSNRIDTAAATIQYTINENLVQKTYTDVNADESGVCDQRNDSFSFYTDDKTIVHDITFAQSSDQSPCFYSYTYFWDYNNDLMSNQFIVHGGSTTTYTLDHPWRSVKSTMRLGESWGNFSNIAINTDGAPGGNTRQFRKTTLLGLQDVTVPAGTFSNCLVIDEQYRGSSALTLESRLYFYCEETALTRYINLTTGQDWQLESYTTN